MMFYESISALSVTENENNSHFLLFRWMTLCRRRVYQAGFSAMSVEGNERADGVGESTALRNAPACLLPPQEPVSFYSVCIADPLVV